MARLALRLRPVWPPRLGRRASGRSFSMISVSVSSVERLDVGGVGHARVGHDRGRVGVDQHDLVAERAQGLAGLGAGVVELAGLADDDRPGADDHDLLYVLAPRHYLRLRCSLPVALVYLHWLDQVHKHPDEQISAPNPKTTSQTEIRLAAEDRSSVPGPRLIGSRSARAEHSNINPHVCTNLLNGLCADGTAGRSSRSCSVLHYSAIRPRRMASATASVRLARAELAEDRADVELHGVLADPEPRGDRLAREPLGEELEHLQLAGREGLGDAPGSASEPRGRGARAPSPGTARSGRGGPPRRRRRSPRARRRGGGSPGRRPGEPPARAPRSGRRSARRPRRPAPPPRAARGRRARRARPRRGRGARRRGEAPPPGASELVERCSRRRPRVLGGVEDRPKPGPDDRVVRRDEHLSQPAPPLCASASAPAGASSMSDRAPPV